MRRNGVVMTSLGGGSSLLTGIAQTRASLLFRTDGRCAAEPRKSTARPAFAALDEHSSSAAAASTPNSCTGRSRASFGTSLEPAGDVRYLGNALAIHLDGILGYAVPPWFLYQ